MEELLQRLQSIHGLSADQAQGVLGTIIGYIKEKFPMVAGAVDNFFPQNTVPVPGASAATGNATQGSSSDFLDKISDMIPRGADEKLEQLAKDKLGGFFGGNKTT